MLGMEYVYSNSSVVSCEQNEFYIQIVCHK